MTTDATKLIEALRGEGLKPRSYSGRGMYGEYCVGVSIDSLDELSAKLIRRFGQPTTDSLGLGIVAYWRGTTWPPGEEE